MTHSPPQPKPTIAEMIAPMVHAFSDEGRKAEVRKIVAAADAQARELEEARSAARKCICAWCGHESSRDPQEILAHQEQCEARKCALEVENRQLTADNEAACKQNAELHQLLARGIQLHEEADRELSSLRAALASAREECERAKSAMFECADGLGGDIPPGRKEAVQLRLRSEAAALDPSKAMPKPQATPVGKDARHECKGQEDCG